MSDESDVGLADLSVSRRQFLRSVSLTLAGSMAGCKWIPCHQNSAAGDETSLRLALVRPVDRLYLHVEAFGFTLEELFGRRALVACKDGRPRRLVYTFPAQHFAETAIQIEGAPPSKLSEDDLKGLGLVPSGRSRVAFDVPDTISCIPVTLEDLLDWSRFNLRLPDLDALAKRSPVQPNLQLDVGLDTDPALKTMTAIELPYGLYLQPLGVYRRDFVWRHSVTPVTRDGRVEGWFTAIVNAQGPSQPVPYEVLDTRGLEVHVDDNGRHIYSDSDSYENDAPVVEKSPTTNFTRLEMIATLSRRFQYTGQALNNVPTAKLCYKNYYTNACYMSDQRLSVSTFGLTSFGGFLDTSTSWHAQPSCALTSVTYQISFGQDHYTRHERAGFLYPFGIPAVLVTLSDRNFIKDGNSHYVAPLLKELYVQIPPQNGIDIIHAESPFQHLSITTRRTPGLDFPSPPAGNPQAQLDLEDYNRCDYFLPRVGGIPFEFEHRGIDHAGNALTSRMPMYFVSNRATMSNGLINEPDLSNPPQTPQLDCVGTAPLLPTSSASPDCLDFSRDFGLRDLDLRWQRAPYRFAKYQGAPIAVAPSATEGASAVARTTIHVEWVEWVRGQVPGFDPSTHIAPQPFLPRARTMRVAPPAMATFNGANSYMLATYRDLRSTKNLGLDPKPTAANADYHANLIAKMDMHRKREIFLSVLPVLPFGNTANFQGLADDAAKKIRQIYYSVTDASALPLELFDDLNNLVSFGQQSTTEALGALATPDSPISLLSAASGPIGDALVDPARYGGLPPLLVPPDRTDFIYFRLAARQQIRDALQDVADLKRLYDDAARDAAQSAASALTAAQSQFVNALTDDVLEHYDPAIALPDLGTLFGMDAEILPGVAFWKVLQGVLPDLAANIPAWVYVRTDVSVQATFDWETDSINDVDLGFVFFKAMLDDGGDAATFSAHASLTASTTHPKPVTRAMAKLTNFSIIILESLEVTFNEVTYTVKEDGTTSFVPSIRSVNLAGALQFVNNLEEVFGNLNGYGIVPKITPTEASVSQTIALPPGGGEPLLLGPAIISNLVFTWGIHIPLIGRNALSASFSLASREEPLTIYVPPWYGGKAYVLIEATTQTVKLFECSLQFGALIYAHYSIAEGEVSVMAGISLLVTSTAQSQTFALSAFVIVSGRLIVASVIEFDGSIVISMTYEGGSNGDQIAGQATVTVSMKVGFVRISYSFTTRHQENRRSASHQLGANSSHSSPLLFDALVPEHFDQADGKCPEFAAGESTDPWFPFRSEAFVRGWNAFVGRYSTTPQESRP